MPDLFFELGSGFWSLFKFLLGETRNVAIVEPSSTTTEADVKSWSSAAEYAAAWRHLSFMEVPKRLLRIGDRELELDF